MDCLEFSKEWAFSKMFGNCRKNLQMVAYVVIFSVR